MRSLDCASNGTPRQAGFRPSTTLRISAGGSDAAKTPQLVKDPVLLLLAPEGTAIGKMPTDSFRVHEQKAKVNYFCCQNDGSFVSSGHLAGSSRAG
jgi:hypothetical protein